MVTQRVPRDRATLRDDQETRPGRVATAYQPKSMAELVGRLSGQAVEKIKWKRFWEFLEQYRQPGANPNHPRPDPSSGTCCRPPWAVQIRTGVSEVPSCGFHSAEHLATRPGLSPPDWSRSRVLATQRLRRSDRGGRGGRSGRSGRGGRSGWKRMEASVIAPAALRKHVVNPRLGGRMNDDGRAELT